MEYRRITAAALASLIAAFGLVTQAGPATAAYNPEDPVQKAEYDAAFQVASEVYEYGLPVLDMARTFRASTSVNVSSGRGGGPVNQFNHFRKLADAKDRTVVLPNSDTLYSMAWMAYEGKLLQTLGNTLQLAVNPFLPKDKRRPLPEAMMTTLRFGPSIFAGTCLTAFLNWRG